MTAQREGQQVDTLPIQMYAKFGTIIKPVACDTDGNLVISATIETGDIQIGAVELKDDDTDTRASIELDSTKNAVYVQSESLATQTTLASILSGQLADGHNVTIDNATIAVTQSGTWDINDISGTISLPTGASTSANQSTMVTALQLIDDAIYTDSDAWSTGTSKHGLVGGIYEASPATIDDGDTSPFRMTVNGAIHSYLINSTIQETDSADHTVTGLGLSVGGWYELPSGVDPDRARTAISDDDFATMAISRYRAVYSVQEADADAEGTETVKYTNIGATANIKQIKDTSGVLYSIQVFNPNTVQAFMSLYNEADTAVTVGTSAVNEYVIPKGDGTNYGALFLEFNPPKKFETAMSVAIVSVLDGDDTNDLSADCVINVEYK